MNNNCSCIAAVIAIETATDDQRVATATCSIRPRECGTVGSKLVYFPNVFASLYHPGACQVSCGPSNNGSLNGVVVRAFHVAMLHVVCWMLYASCRMPHAAYSPPALLLHHRHHDPFESIIIVIVIAIISMFMEHRCRHRRRWCWCCCRCRHRISRTIVGRRATIAEEMTT